MMSLETGVETVSSLAPPMLKWTVLNEPPTGCDCRNGKLVVINLANVCVYVFVLLTMALLIPFHMTNH